MSKTYYKILEILKPDNDGNYVILSKYIKDLAWNTPLLVNYDPADDQAYLFSNEDIQEIFDEVKYIKQFIDKKEYDLPKTIEIIDDMVRKILKVNFRSLIEQDEKL